MFGSTAGRAQGGLGSARRVVMMRSSNSCPRGAEHELAGVAHQPRWCADESVSRSERGEGSRRLLHVAGLIPACSNASSAAFALRSRPVGVRVNSGIGPTVLSHVDPAAATTRTATPRKMSID